MTLWRERAPEVWGTGEPYFDLALAVTLRAKQDIMAAAKLAKAVLDDAVSTERLRKAYRAMKTRKPESALWHFAASFVWRALCGQMGSGDIPLAPTCRKELFASGRRPRRWGTPRHLQFLRRCFEERKGRRRLDVDLRNRGWTNRLLP